MEMNSFIKDIQDKKVIYIGEYHDSKLHHSIQLKIIKKIKEHNSKIAVGLEMFESKYQDIINDYIYGKINEEEFLEKTQYKEKWGFNYSLYKPLINYFREERIHIIALNMESEIIKKISNYGISSLSSHELNRLPGHIDFTNERYRKMLFKIFKQHPKISNNDFQRFYSAQIVRDEEMAENIDRLLKNNPEYQVVVLAGNGHIIYSHGIPSRTYNRNQFTYVTIVNDIQYEPEVADYTITTDRCTDEQRTKEPAM